jgi:hypothetical protein
MGDSNKWLTNEFGFWIVVQSFKVDGKAVSRYYYSQPQSHDSDQVELDLPKGVIVVGNWHTHPHTIKTGDFSTGDKRSFKAVKAVRPGIAFYLLNPASQIRRAQNEGDFPAGVGVDWNDKIKP